MYKSKPHLGNLLGAPSIESGDQLSIGELSKGENEELVPTIDRKKVMERLETLVNEIQASSADEPEENASTTEFGNLKTLQRYLLKAQIALHELDSERTEQVATILGISKTDFTSEKDSLSQHSDEVDLLQKDDTSLDFAAHLKRQKLQSLIYITQLIVLLIMYFGLFMAYEHAAALKEKLILEKSKLLDSFETSDPKCQAEFQVPDFSKIKCYSTDGSPKTKVPTEIGSVCTFSCQPGYRLTGKSSTKCVLNKYNASWAKPFPVCKNYPCSAVQDRDCNGLRNLGIAHESGVYEVVQCQTYKTLQVYCNFLADGGGWTAIQRRLGPDTSFDKTQREFQTYFGKATGSYWLGLSNINVLTNAVPQSLLVILIERKTDSKAYAFYDYFAVSNYKEMYRLHVSGYNSQKALAFGKEAGDGLQVSNGMQFTTKGEDRDWNALKNCAELANSAWWHRNCTDANLNAEYSLKSSYGEHTLYWRPWRKMAALKSVEMFIRPKIN
ncbi:uncharacterized protein LOC108949684 [Ciona intestinalis]